VTLASPSSDSEVVADGQSVYRLEYAANWDGGPVSSSVLPAGVVTLRAVPAGGGR
jgi:hypothetical protein